MSDTPRTDAKAQFFGFNPDEGEEFVQADFARELERENAELQEKVDDWENATLGALDHRPDEKHCTCVPPLIGKVRQLERENAALRLTLNEAATSLCTISQQAGRTDELREMSQIRGYAFSRYSAAIDAARKEQS